MHRDLRLVHSGISNLPLGASCQGSWADGVGHGLCGVPLKVLHSGRQLHSVKGEE